MPNLVQWVANFFFPPKCIFCREVLPISVLREASVCGDCERTLPYTVAQRRCKSCGRPMKGKYVHCSMCRNHPGKPFVKISSAYFYRGRVKTAIVRFKKETYRGYAEVFARHLTSVIAYDCPGISFDAVVSAPPRKMRMQIHGYDQAETLARELGKRMGIPYIPYGLQQKESRKKQSSLSALERWNNAEDNVKVSSKPEWKGKTILLVDDVCTTGATLYASARALKDAGVSAVYCAVAASTEKA
ncbi:MAG: ComF family protein [Clostridia bacterium]|nr:ComF family protein [Clostridia bacterium]